MSKPIHHKLDIYGTHLHLAFDRTAWAALRRQHPGLEPSKDLGLYGQVSDTTHEPSGQQHVWIFIDVVRHQSHQPEEMVDTIAHEATHVAQAIFTRGAIDNTGLGEPFAYLVGWVTAWIWRHAHTRHTR